MFLGFVVENCFLQLHVPPVAAGRSTDVPGRVARRWGLVDTC